MEEYIKELIIKDYLEAKLRVQDIREKYSITRKEFEK